MLNNQTIQDTINGLKTITGRDFDVLDREGKIVASTQTTTINSQIDSTADFINSEAQGQLLNEHQYFKVFDNDGIIEYVVSIKGEDEEAYRLGKIVAFQIKGLIAAYKERYDKDNFIKSLLLDNMLVVDIYSRASRLLIDKDARRVAYVVEAQERNILTFIETLRSTFPNSQSDFIIAVDQDNVIVIKELGKEDNKEAIETYAKEIVESLSTVASHTIRVGIGIAVDDLRFASRSYKEAKLALEVGRIFDEDSNIMNYEALGLGRLVYQLPPSLCRMFVNEVLAGMKNQEFDAETIDTVDKFFENSLNVSETARNLFIHRNTLVYRLDKIARQTGLDLRSFDHAIIFKMTLMVKKYMARKEWTTY